MSDDGMFGPPEDPAMAFELPLERVEREANAQPPIPAANTTPQTRREIEHAQRVARVQGQAPAATPTQEAPAPSADQSGDLSAEVAALRDDLLEQRIREEAIFENPEGAAAWALQQGRPELYREALDELYSAGDSESIATAVRLETARTMADVQIAQHHERSLGEWARSHPELDARQEAMVQVAASRPDLRAAIEQGGPGQFQALDQLYELAGASQASSPAGRSRGSSAAERIGGEWEQIDRVHSDGWNI